MLPIVSNGPPGTLPPLSERIEYLSHPAQIVFSDDAGGVGPKGFGGMHLSGPTKESSYWCEVS